MNRHEYDAFLQEKNPQRLTGSLLADQTPRTLLYGYTCNRDTFHVYLGEDGRLHRVLYTFEGFLLGHADETTLDLSAYVPDKRLYPETCDLAFCQLLKSVDVSLPFTTFNEERIPALWYGKQLPELIVLEAGDVIGKEPFDLEQLQLPDKIIFSGWDETPADHLQRQLETMLAEMLTAAYRRMKYKGEAPDKMLQALPSNIEWAVNREARNYPVPYFAQDYVEYKMPDDVAASLKQHCAQRLGLALPSQVDMLG